MHYKVVISEARQTIFRMAYAQSKIQQNLQVKLNRALGLVSRLAISNVREDNENSAKLAVEVQEANDDLQYNSESAVDLLVKGPREKYNEFVEPQFTKGQAKQEYERQRRQRLTEIYAARQRVEDGTATEEDLARTDLNMADLIINNNEPFMKIGGAYYMVDIDGSVDETRPIQYDGLVTEDLLKGCAERDPGTGNLHLHKSLENCVDRASKMGMSRAQLDDLLKLFVKEEMKTSFGSIKRLMGQSLFDAILGLSSYHSQISSLMLRLGNVQREPDQSPEIALFAVKSLCLEIAALTTPDLEEYSLNSKIDGILKRILPKLISPVAQAEYNSYLRGMKIQLGTELSLQQRLDFINNLETEPQYQVNESVRLRKSDVPASLFWSKSFDPMLTGKDAMRGFASAGDVGEELHHELFYTDDVRGPGPGLVNPPALANVPPPRGLGSFLDGAGGDGRPGLPALTSEGGRYTHPPSGPGHEIITKAIVHQSGSGATTPGRGSAMGKSPGPDSRPASPWRGRSPGRRDRGRSYQAPARSPVPERRDRSVNAAPSPTSGRARLFRQGPNGSMHDLSRENLYTYNKEKGFVPRSQSRSPRRPEYKSPGEVPTSHCKRCLRYVEGKTNTCTPSRCLRYLEARVTSRMCPCKGGFHEERICGRNGTPPASRSGTPVRSGFNPKYSGN